ncbi:MAG: metalloregulator ArsR/SmtB family transcription factor [bacterium]
MSKENFDKLFKSMSEFFALLSNPDRIKILGLLKEKEMDVNDIQVALEISQSRVSQHLKLLKLNSLVKERRCGRNVYYTVTDSRVTTVVQSALQFQMLCMTTDLNVIDSINELMHIWHF